MDAQPDIFERQSVVSIPTIIALRAGRETARLDGLIRDFERLYLQLMIPHHEAGIVMTDVILERSNNPAVTNLAQAMRNAQQAEIQYMTDLLQAR